MRIGNEDIGWHAIGVVAAIISAIAIPTATAFMTWGSVTTQLQNHDKRLQRLEDRDDASRASDVLVLQRLTGIETKVEILLGIRNHAAASDKMP